MSFKSGPDNFGSNGLLPALAISLVLHAVLLWQKAPTAAGQSVQSGLPRQVVLLNASLRSPMAPPALAATSPAEVREKQQDLPAQNKQIAAMPHTEPRTLPQNFLEAAVSVGQGLDANGLRQYRLSLAAAARNYRIYPAQALQNGWRGTAEVSFAVAANGVSQPVQLLRSSGHAMLDAAAMEMIDQAARRTVLPASLRGQSFSVPLPVVFDVDEQ